MESDENSGSVAETWGKINSLHLENMHSKCVLTLPASSSSLPAVSFEGETIPLTPDIENLENIPVGFSIAAELACFLAPPPPLVDDNKVLTLKLMTEKSPDGKNVRASISRNFQSGKSYKIYLRLTTHGMISAEVVAGEWIDQDDFLHVDSNTGMYYDLSESHSANTYVVSSAYSYCFDATVRGNGYTGIA
jgi:hypothetical protein